MVTQLAHTPLTEWHAAHGGRMVDFAGWSMPVQYASIVAEHQATRTVAGLFDISHMGRLRFSGPDAGSWLDHLVTRPASKLEPGQIIYAFVTNEAGGILDDVLVYRLTEGSGQSYFLMVVNASNRQKIVEWIEQHRGDFDADFQDLTLDTAMIAVQGPQALKFAQPLIATDMSRMKYYTGAETRIGVAQGMVSRTGYTGEDGCELIVDSAHAQEIWNQLVAAGATPAGLGCRDTLRLEADMPLYGHELNETTNPFQAGLGFAVELEGAEFPGARALRQVLQLPSSTARVGLELAGKRVPREGFSVINPANQQAVGHVTSGTFSPTFEKPLAMAYVESSVAAPGTPLLVDIRGRAETAVVVKLPFYRRPRPTL